MKKIFLILIIPCLLFSKARYRHVQEEWNTKSVNLNRSLSFSVNSWHYLDWFGAYYQTGDFWIYHCNKGWMYPESDGNEGVWFYWGNTESWVWTNESVYPFAWDSVQKDWFNFCEDKKLIHL